jgi:primosomal protein N' (replication factor Y) (superfamily II helicase)
VSGQALEARTQSRRRPARKRQPGQERLPAADLPVARVAVDISLPHLDRPFDYLVPAKLAAAAVPGCQVRVRFAGQLTGGFVLERLAESDHPGKLGYLERVVSPEVVLTPEIAGLARAVADRYGGTMADVLRLAIPPRHAAASKARHEAASEYGAAPAGGTSPPGGEADPAAAWQRYPDGPAFLRALAGGRSPRAVWSALPGPTWPGEIAQAVAAVARSGRGAVVVVPDARDLTLVDTALASAVGSGRHVVLSASLGPAERYRRWLAVARGEVRVAAGTRSAMFAPVADLGLVVLWDDGDDLHAEPRAPYPNAREVLALRAHRAGAAALIGGFARTAELTQLVAAGWARSLAARPEAMRQAAPLVRAAPDEAELARDAAAMTARLPSLALRAARAALADGPVLVQVPRRGYLASIACGRCRAQARCAACGGPLQISGSHQVPGCRWCGALAADWACARCGYGQVRALVTGAARTAEELGRAFPGVPVRSSGGEHVLAAVAAEPALVIATPGAEPVAADGYAAALLLDGWALLGRPSLRAAEEALRRWLNAAALVRPAGRVVVLAESSLPAVQALVRWDPVSFSERELAERAELGFPPAVRMASVTGPPDAVAEFVASVSLPDRADVLGPVPVETRDGLPESQERALIRVGRADGLALARALHAAQATRSARKDGAAVRVQLDPAELA